VPDSWQSTDQAEFLGIYKISYKLFTDEKGKKRFFWIKD